MEGGLFFARGRDEGCGFGVGEGVSLGGVFFVGFFDFGLWGKDGWGGKRKKKKKMKKMKKKKKSDERWRNGCVWESWGARD